MMAATAAPHPLLVDKDEEVCRLRPSVGTRDFVMYAVIATGGKQYRVQPGETIKIEKLEGAKDQGAVTFDQVLLVADGADVKVGAPTLPGATVTGEVLVASGKGEKLLIYKYRRRKGYRRKNGHRQLFTAVKITGITGA
jgi:large subunit ribosomal protein L21